MGHLFVEYTEQNSILPNGTIVAAIGAEFGYDSRFDFSLHETAK
jgi:hypothetical protein